jgi:hypothetical protein
MLGVHVEDFFLLLSFAAKLLLPEMPEDYFHLLHLTACSSITTQ